MNPLFPDDPHQTDGYQANDNGGYILPKQHGNRVEPRPGADSAIELIRRKVDALFDDEPNAKQEIAEAQDTVLPRSKHQQFMYELSTSGKPLAEIQTAWHNYYANLPDHEKKQVWQEFYAANGQHPSAYTKYVQRKHAAEHPHRPEHYRKEEKEPEGRPQNLIVVSEHTPAPEPPPDRRSMATIKKQINRKVSQQNQKHIKAKQNLQSLAFGLGIGAIVLIIALFSFFNEMIIAPFIRPSGKTETPIILSTDGVAPTSKSEVIIPKINAELPVVYGNSSNENDIEKNLESGVAHYPSTVFPGQQGNAAFFGHSSNNIFNKGQYKFAFVLLHELEPGDVFYLTRNGTVYTYKVYEKKVVQPTETWVLNAVQSKTATATLITCDPPGTSLHRLVVWGEQINPDPAANSTPPVITAAQPKELPSNSPSLWSRFWNWIN